MNTYAIYEGNLDRIEKKFKTIQNKCVKYGRNFHYRQVGEEFRTVEIDGIKETLRYVLVEVEGKISHGNWNFIAVVDHEEGGNVIRVLDTDIQIPEKYYTSGPICEHCNTHRKRKDTYLIHNDSTDEWKQVGRSCLTEFTQGMDAEEVARYVSIFDEVIKGESFTGSSHHERYYSVEELLHYAFETVKKFGYQRSTDWEEYPTVERCMDYYSVCKGEVSKYSSKAISRITKEMEEVNFFADSDNNIRLSEDAITWICSQSDDNTYIHNLKVTCSSEWCASRNLGILISLAKTYTDHLSSEEREKQFEQQSSKSEFVGRIGDRLTFTAVDVKCIYTSESQYGLNFMYRMHDEDGNVYMWSTSNFLNSEYSYQIVGTVKNHEEYRGTKQTWLTRCRTAKLNKHIEDDNPEDRETYEDDTDALLNETFN